MGLFPPIAGKGASLITMNVSLPCLIFANVVPAFTPSNISAIGPLFLVAFIYTVLGYLSGLIIRESLYVPRNFWHGVVVLCTVSNWGNLRELCDISLHVLILYQYQATAIVVSITKQPPFDPSTDQACE